jgi:hypothetical protein
MGELAREELLRRLNANHEQLKQAHSAGNTDLKLGLREQAVDIISELHGPKSREALVARGQVGLALFDTRRFAEAEKIFSDLLLDRANLLGHDHEETLSTRGEDLSHGKGSVKIRDTNHRVGVCRPQHLFN